jgi:hypothetical protein
VQISSAFNADQTVAKVPCLDDEVVRWHTHPRMDHLYNVYAKPVGGVLSIVGLDLVGDAGHLCITTPRARALATFRRIDRMAMDCHARVTAQVSGPKRPSHYAEKKVLGGKVNLRAANAR